MTAQELIDGGFRRGGLDGVGNCRQCLDRRGADIRGKPLSCASNSPAERFASWVADYERPCEEHPLKLMTPPARHFLNSTFALTPTSRLKERGSSPSVGARARPTPCH
jgi:hypothetical protein